MEKGWGGAEWGGSGNTSNFLNCSTPLPGEQTAQAQWCPTQAPAPSHAQRIPSHLEPVACSSRTRSSSSSAVSQAPREAQKPRRRQRLALRAPGMVHGSQHGKAGQRRKPWRCHAMPRVPHRARTATKQGRAISTSRRGPACRFVIRTLPHLRCSVGSYFHSTCVRALLASFCGSMWVNGRSVAHLARHVQQL